MNNLTIAYPHEGAPVVLLSGCVPFSHHVALFKATEDAEKYKRVEVWRNLTGRVKAKNLVPFDASSYEQVPSVATIEAGQPEDAPSEPLSADPADGGEAESNKSIVTTTTEDKVAAEGPTAGDVPSSSASADSESDSESDSEELIPAPEQAGRKANEAKQGGKSSASRGMEAVKSSSKK